MRMLQKGNKLNLANTKVNCIVKEFLGGGGQGEVYKVSVDDNDLALKWYFPNQATEKQKDTIKNLIKIGAPNSSFLWPSAIIENSSKSFGYIMPLRDSCYKSIVDLMKRRISPSFKNIITACIELSHSFYQLHSKGLCYRDISFGNVFFNPDTGKVLICDNDNVNVDGDAETSVLGTPRFMAPEIVRGDEKPSTQTDLFSLAILLFYMLMVHHPLEGEKEKKIKCFDLPAMNKLYGTEPVFIFDPKDTSNRPNAEYQKNANIYWNIYPIFVKEMFIKAFTQGIHKPNERVRETEWRACMIKLCDSIFYCNHCGNENFFDEEQIKLHGKLNSCWSCKKEMQKTPSINIGKHKIMLNHDTVLFASHIDKQNSYDFSTPVAKVTQHPKNPQIWGLKNLSDKKWVATGADGKMVDIEPEKSTQIIKNKKINFGTQEGIFS